jgi:hypothetical protein
MAERLADRVAVPRLYPEHDRTRAVRTPYLIRVPGVLKPLLQLVFDIADRAIDQPIQNARSDMEIASQAEYAGSIAVIGSTEPQVSAFFARPGNTIWVVSAVL